MQIIPGTLQEGGAPFRSTHWSVVVQAAQSQPVETTDEAVGRFCQDYWPPLYTFLRRRGYPSADAQDITQAFLAELLKQKSLARANPEKGRLRAYLLGALQNFLANEYDRARALKRGGGQQIVSLSNHLAEAEAAISAADAMDATGEYDRSWATALTRKAWQRLRASFAKEGKTALFVELEPLVIGGSNQPPEQSELATRLGMPISNLRTHLHRLRQRYRDALRAEVADTVTDPKQVDEELRYLFQILIS